ncbi:PKD domain-containing protein [Desulfobulbus rhabdoformis]|uniref:PKD domain-containing protein n=1 Tax=Desulfobulbus rhabdoformis TaxID=34032 RepID=UPI0019668F41|nr:PKD domain-containing protein [Desulfobulbus rhabdoformis]MBM9616841.1 PKD domain-containing protein [Desulfobulbus rhabdoformis]
MNASTILTGLFSLCLFSPAMAADFSGNLKEISITDAAATNKPPTASFTYANNGGIFTFDASGSTDSDGAITEYRWDFGNGIKGTGATATVTYTPGTYPVTLTVVDDAEGVALAQQSINYAEGMVLEDAEDGTTLGWTIYDNTPEGATFTNEFDTARNSRVISLKGSDRDNGFALANDDGSGLLIEDKLTISLSFATSGSYMLYIQTTTSAGKRYLVYSEADTDKLGTSTYIYYGLGQTSMDGAWKNVTRDLQTDLTTAQPGVTLMSVDKVLVRGAMKIDDIILK